MGKQKYVRVIGSWVLVASILFLVACTDEVEETSPMIPSITETRETSPMPTQTESRKEEILPTSFYDDDDLAQQIDALGLDHFQGTVFVGLNGQRTLEMSYGYADVETTLYLSESSIYEIGLLTSQLTRVAFLNLMEEEDLDVNSLLSEYIPEYEYADQITLKQISEMSSGIPDYLNETIADPFYVQRLINQGLTSQESLDAINTFGDLDVSFEDVLEIIQTRQLQFEPGKDRAFSATEYIFMAEIISRVSGVPYVHYMQRNILTPMQLESASFAVTSHTATGYIIADQMQVIVPPSQLESEGGLRMNAADFFSWTETMIPELLAFQEEGDQIFIPMMEELPRSVYMARSSFGGFYCIQMIIPEIELVVVIMSNQNGINQPAKVLMDTILEYYVDQYDIYEEN